MSQHAPFVIDAAPAETVSSHGGPSQGLPSQGVPSEGTPGAETASGALVLAPGVEPQALVPLFEDLAARVRWNDAGLVLVVVQEASTNAVLMLAWADADALAHTLETRRGTYWSRSRRELWVKGATSGHTQRVREVRLDCDGDTILYRVDQDGPACHTGASTCFDADLVLSDSTPADPKLADPPPVNAQPTAVSTALAIEEVSR